MMTTEEKKKWTVKRRSRLAISIFPIQIDEEPYMEAEYTMEYSWSGGELRAYSGRYQTQCPHMGAYVRELDQQAISNLNI